MRIIYFYLNISAMNSSTIMNVDERIFKLVSTDVVYVQGNNGYPFKKKKCFKTCNNNMCIEKCDNVNE